MATLFIISKHFCAHVVPGVSQLFHAHVLPRFRAFSILYLSIVLGLAYLYMIFLSYRRFQALKDQYKWLRLESKFFSALIKDVQYVSDLGKEVDEKAHQLWDSQLRPGATVQLSDVEKEWVHSIKTSVIEANRHCDAYERLSRRRQLPRWVYSVLMDFREYRPLGTKIDAIIDEMFEHLFMKCDKIYGALERSRSNVRSLRDRPIPDVVRDSKEDIQYNIEFPVKLLLAFLEDLDGLRMETETEKAWVKFVEETILELQQGMDGILKIASRMNWIFYIGNWIARRELKKKYQLYDRMLWFLIIHKSVCDFKFIRRDVLKSVHRSSKKQTFSSQSQATTTDNDDISSFLNIFNSQIQLINQGPAKEWFTKLYETLRRLNKLLMVAKAVEGIKPSRMAWTDQLKIIFKDAERSLKSYAESSRSGWDENQNKTETQSKPKQIGRFNMGLRILETCIEKFRTEPGEERNSAVGLDEDAHEVVSRLITSNENCSTHFIVGMRGIGKTTLAKLVYDHTAIKNYFNFRYWMPLTDRGDEEKNALLKKLGQNLMDPPVTNKGKEEGTNKEKKDKEEESNKEAKEKNYSFKEINDFLKAKKYLIVLDNISSVEIWESLKPAFRDSTNGSRILITTRHMGVASNAENPHQLRLRTKDESSSLFQQMVPLPLDTSDQPELSKAEAQKLNSLAYKVLGRCGGLPLSILHLGYLLSGMKNVTSKQLTRPNGNVKTCGFPSALRDLWLQNHFISLFHFIFLSFTQIIIILTLQLCDRFLLPFITCLMMKNNVGVGQKPAEVFGSPEDDPMPELEKLPKLKCLSLYAGSYIGKSMSCSKGGFPQLQVLNFLKLKELEEWNVVEEAMPNLKKLEIRSCYSLKVPNGLRNLKTLGELKLRDMSVKFTLEIEKTKEKIWADIAISPAIIIDEPYSTPNGA
ncbi:putative disease resistance protein [Quercus suber]|uniref:Disease resistance protein n=1 Tax=Quercus suber TaxID=58331 RepID=A0AAW0JYA6_QUESU